MKRLLMDRYSGNQPCRNDPRPANLIRLADDYGYIGSIDKASMGGGRDFWEWHVAEADVVRATGRHWLQGLTHWIDPGQNLTRQADYFLVEIDNVLPDFLLYDIEQYKAWLTGLRFAAAKIYDAVVFVIEYVSSMCRLPWMAYSATWFLRPYCPALVDWIGDHPALVASYADYGQRPRRVTRAGFLAWVAQVAAMPMPTSGVGVLRNPVVRQVSSTQQLACCPANYDASIILDDPAFDAWLAGGPQ
jgi:hypothetical protein